MNESKGWLKVKLPVIVITVILVAFIAAVYIYCLNRTITSNIIENISELADHDQTAIQASVETTWNELLYLEGKFKNYKCTTIEEIEEQMNVECANSEFSHIYIIAEDGKVYTDKYVTYDPESDGANGRIDLLPLFEDGKEHIVTRFNDKYSEAGLTKENLLYGVRLTDFYIGDVKMVALVGISDITYLQDDLIISSFEGRGYSSVIDENGDYIVDMERTVYLNQHENFFERLGDSKRSDLTMEEVDEKMQNDETFSFFYTNNSDGKERIVYCIPFIESGANWYFLSAVESTVFSEQNHAFLLMSILMLVAIALVVVIAFVIVWTSQNKIIAANAEAQARSSFLANMSHEIRTPLNGIIGLIFLMEKDVEDDAEKSVLRQRLSKAKDTAQYLLSLINNILDISKLQAGKVEIQNDVISPETITDAIWSMQKSSMESRGIFFAVHKDITVPWIIGDDLIIKQVLMNILSNAMKFTPTGGTVALSVTQAREGPDRVTTTFTCADTGCGMSREFIEHIWDSFSQERGKNSDSVKGTGLGMAISKVLVDAVGGEISVESKQGEGSIFRVVFHSEIAPEQPNFLKEINERVSVIPPHERTKILVAEDNELNSEILVEILEGEGFDVISAANGGEAVAQFENSEVGEIDVILMDMQMPVMDGCEATKRIRAMDRADAETVNIFACTANNFNEDREQAEASGMNDFLSKPIDVTQLLKKLGAGVRPLAEDSEVK